MADVGDSPSSSLPRLEPGAVFAGYLIQGLLDRGGMGVVYRATDPDLDRSIALKIIAPEHTQNPTAVARFKAEARLAASLEHPNIVPIHRGGEHEGVLYLAMRLVPGCNLREVIDGSRLDLQRTARIVSEIADALDTAHAAGLVHRDVKPANILVAGQGAHEHAYLTDFGLTKRLGSAGDLTRTGGWVGTPDYVAPEQIQGHKVDGRADIYSLGCVVYEMLTGHVAYPKDSHMAKLWAHVTDPPPLPRRDRPELLESFDAVVARATAKAPEERFATAGELAAALRAAVGEQEAKRRFDAARATQPAGAREPAMARDDVFVDRSARPVAAAAGGAAPPAAPVGDGPRAEAHEPRRRRGWPLVAAGALILGTAAVAAAAVLLTGGSSGGGGAARAPSGTPVNAELGPVPFNRVYDGVGKVTMRLNGDIAEVRITASGLLNGAGHSMHLHAGARGECPHGNVATLHNGRRVITTQDGGKFYGPPVTAFTTAPGKTDPRTGLLDYRHYPFEIPINYSRRIDLGPVVATQIRQNTSAVVVIHGIDYNHNYAYDNGLSTDKEHRSLPIEQTAPALCGPLKATEPQDGAHTASAPRVYTATLVPTSPKPSASALVCNLRSLAGKLL
jgi:serine/threonine-protein kinase